MKGVTQAHLIVAAFAAMGCAGGVREVPGFWDKEKPQRKSFNHGMISRTWFWLVLLTLCFGCSTTSVTIFVEQQSIGTPDTRGRIEVSMTKQWER